MTLLNPTPADFFKKACFSDPLFPAFWDKWCAAYFETNANAETVFGDSTYHELWVNFAECLNPHAPLSAWWHSCAVRFFNQHTRDKNAPARLRETAKRALAVLPPYQPRRVTEAVADE
jgi:hypothetical protein